MPIAPNFLERLLLGRLNLLPGLLLDYGATLGFRAVLAAVRLGIFDALTSGPRATSDLAAATTVNPGALGPLLVALRSLGYVQGTDRGWSLTRQSRRWLTTGSPDSIVAGLPFLEWNALGIWNDLEAVVRSGSPPRDLYAVLESAPDLSSSFQAWDRIAGRLVGPALAQAMPVTNRTRRLLDLGGGNGIYSLLLCRRHPRLSTTILDLPGALPSAHLAIAEAGLGDRVSTRAGDFLADDLGSGFDAVLIANVVHGLSMAEAELIVRRATSALAPRGVLIVLDQSAADAGGSATSAITALLGLGYLVTLGGRTWAPETIRGWLQDAGLVDIGQKQIRRAPGNVLVTGRMP